MKFGLAGQLSIDLCLSFQTMFSQNLYIFFFHFSVSPPGPINERTLECSNKKDQSYTQCKIDGAYLVDKVNMKIQFQENKTCTEGINYGIVADSIFVKDGCSGIFTVDFFPGMFKNW